MQPIYCFGDSHISIFSGNDLCTPNSLIVNGKFQIKCLGPILAYNAYDRFSTSMFKVPSGSFIILCFGEIDCRTQIRKRSDITKQSPDYIIDEICKLYITCFIKARDEGYEVMCLSIPPERMEFPGESYFTKIDITPIDKFFIHSGSLEERQEYKKSFNNKMKALCLKEKIEFINLYDYCILPDGSVNSHLYMDDIHLDSKKVFPAVESIVSLYLETKTKK